MPPKSKTKASSAAISKARQDNKTRNGVSKRNKNPLRKKTPISNNTNGQKKIDFNNTYMISSMQAYILITSGPHCQLNKYLVVAPK